MQRNKNMEIFAILMNLDTFTKLLDLLSDGYIEGLLEGQLTCETRELSEEIVAMVDSLNEPCINRRLVEIMIGIVGILKTKEFLEHAAALKNDDMQLRRSVKQANFGRDR